jgi:FkbM family methyltransferase
MRKVFLDCGTNLCQGLNQISNENKIDESWIVYSFDANPDVYNHIDKSKFPNVSFINEGVWNESCYRPLAQELCAVTLENGFLLTDVKIGGSSNIMGGDYKWGDWIEKENILSNSLEIKCFDLSSFIKDKFSKEDYIIVKLDIEGSEYVVMDKLISDGTIDYVNHFYIEWHAMRDINKYDYINFIHSKKIKYTEWY